MKGAVLYGPHDVRFEEPDDLKIVDLTDAIIRISASWLYSDPLGRAQVVSRTISTSQIMV